MKHPYFIIATFAAPAVFAGPVRSDDPFASVVVDFRPAPGQYAHDEDFNDPGKALGPPVGGGLYDGNESSVVSLGGFGGYIILKFDHMVEDHPLNPFGMDAIVFGNAFWIGSDANHHWAECATIEIALDANGNECIDENERWYLIPGSHITDPAMQYATRTWDDNPDTSTPPDLITWVPPGYAGTWTTSAYELPPEPFAQPIIGNPSPEEDREGIHGYAEYTPTLVLGDMDADNQVDDPGIAPDEFYTIPDDPLTVGITPGSGGGDAFDVAWAIDPDTGKPAHLPGFNFIRITNPTDVILPFFNEKSPEIDAVADVAPDPFADCDQDGDIDLADVICLQQCYECQITQDETCQYMDRDGDGYVDTADAAAFVLRLTGPK